MARQKRAAPLPWLRASWSDSSQQFVRGMTIQARGSISAIDEGLGLHYVEVQPSPTDDDWIRVTGSLLVPWNLFTSDIEGLPCGMGRGAADAEGELRLVFITCRLLVHAVTEPVMTEEFELWATFFKSHGLPFSS